MRKTCTVRTCHNAPIPENAAGHCIGHHIHAKFGRVPQGKIRSIWRKIVGLKEQSGRRYWTVLCATAGCGQEVVWLQASRRGRAKCYTCENRDYRGRRKTWEQRLKAVEGHKCTPVLHKNGCIADYRVSCATATCQNFFLLSYLFKSASKPKLCRACGLTQRLQRSTKPKYIKCSAAGCDRQIRRRIASGQSCQPCYFKRMREKWPFYQQMLTRMKRKAEANNRDFSLTPEHLQALYSMKSCFYCCAPIRKRQRDGEARRFRSKGYCVDRMDNSRGYEPKNVVPCCKVCNTKKGAHMTWQAAIVKWHPFIKNRQMVEKCTSVAALVPHLSRPEDRQAALELNKMCALP